MSQHRTEVAVPGQATPISHYTHANIAGGFAFVSGMVPSDADGEIVAKGDIVGQTRQVFANLGAVLDACGCEPADVCKVTVYLTDVADRTRVNPVRQQFFGDALPASTLVEVQALYDPQILIEVEAIAHVPGQ